MFFFSFPATPGLFYSCKHFCQQKVLSLFPLCSPHKPQAHSRRMSSGYHPAWISPQATVVAPLVRYILVHDGILFSFLLAETWVIINLNCQLGMCFHPHEFIKLRLIDICLHYLLVCLFYLDIYKALIMQAHFDLLLLSIHCQLLVRIPPSG